MGPNGVRNKGVSLYTNENYFMYIATVNVGYGILLTSSIASYAVIAVGSSLADAAIPARHAHNDWSYIV